VALSTDRWRSAGALALYLLLAAWMLRAGFDRGAVMVSGESLRASLPWSEVLPPREPHNRFLGDETRIYYPYLLEAAAVYRGEADPVWTHHAGGGLPFLGDMTSSLLHPLTLLAAWFPVPLVPLLQALAVLSLSSWFTFLFLRRLRLGWPSALLGGLAFGFGGHQVLWLQYALSHTLLGLPFCLWAVERIVEDRSRRRLALLAIGLALIVCGGHPETAFVSAIVVLLWSLWRMWDAQGRFQVAAAALLAAALAAVQWLPFLEYAHASHGRWLREIEAARGGGGRGLGASIIFLGFGIAALALLRSSIERSFFKRAAAIGAGVAVLVMARRMGMAVSAGVSVLPGMYGSPLGGGEFSGAQDFPGLDAGYAGVLPVLLLAIGAIIGVGGGFVRFFAVGSLILWGAAFHMPGVEAGLRLLPGFAQLGPTRLLGPVGFMTACGGAMVLDRLCGVAVKPGLLTAVGRVGVTLLLVVGGTLLALRIPADPQGGRPLIPGLISPAPDEEYPGTAPVPIVFTLPEAVDDLRVLVDGRLLRSGRAAAAPADAPVTVLYDAQRAEEGRHALRVEADRGGATTALADQPLAISRPRRIAPRDALMVLLAVGLLGALATGRRSWAPWAGAALVGLDVLSFGRDYNAACPQAELYPPTRTVEFLRAQPGPFRIFTEGTILPPDTPFAEGLEHLLGYDNLGYHTHYLWLLAAGVDMDAFATFRFSRESVKYGAPRFDALDVRYVITDRATDLSDVPGFRLAHESETRVWENTENLGRAWIVGGSLNILREQPARLDAADLGQVALLETDLDRPLGGRGTAHVRSSRGGRIEVEVDCDGDALLVLAVNRGPGWLASVDSGPEQPTLACDVAWQACLVPAGRHVVTLRVDSPAVRRGLVISLAAAAIVLLMVLLPRQLS
jgi:hypothetical protein